jgi:hypothetical protein
MDTFASAKPQFKPQSHQQNKNKKPFQFLGSKALYFPVHYPPVCQGICEICHLASDSILQHVESGILCLPETSISKRVASQLLKDPMVGPRLSTTIHQG